MGLNYETFYPLMVENISFRIGHCTNSYLWQSDYILLKFCTFEKYFTPIVSELPLNKKKIINDPVLGFINIQSEIVFDLIEQPVFQRLRRIKQLGLSYLVFPGANHSRFEHALGASHLMRQAISVLRLKGIEITNDEADAVTIAILLHDIGHAPFSHVLENTLVDISHEKISLLLMNELNSHFKINWILQ